MEIDGKVLVVTGGGGGIGGAIAERFAAAGALVVVGDLDPEAADAAAARIMAAGGAAVGRRADVTVELDIVGLVAEAEKRFGPVDIMCSNAGMNENGGAEAPDAVWDRAWRINAMAHVHAARAVLPSMLARRTGYILNNVSAAGLLAAPGAAAYTTSKHAAIGFAEWLSITHGSAGIRVSVICPQAVRTAMLESSLASGNAATREIARLGRTIEPADVAAAVEEGVRAERFLILPHPEVLDLYRKKHQDIDRWLGGMQRFLGRLGGA